MSSKPIVVVGSINIDLVVKSERLPVPGETILGGEFRSHPGGKGANQAGAAARLGHPVFMIGRVGRDLFGQELLGFLGRAGVDTSFVAPSDTTTGTAIITVTPGGQNSIIVASGANSEVSPEDLDLARGLIRSASLVLAQLEIPMRTVENLAEICAEEQVPLVLDPAPAQVLAPELLRTITWITPNEVEARQLQSFAGAASSPTPKESAEGMLALGARNVVLKLGECGAFLATAAGLRTAVPAFPVKAVDTTGAGDAFNGAFAVALARGAEPLEAARFASAVAAISVTRHGALPSMPAEPEVDAFLQNRSHMEIA